MLALYEPSRSLAHLPTACRALTHGRSLRRLVPYGQLGVRFCSEKREQETPDPPEPQTFGEKLVVFGLGLRGLALLPRFAGSAQLLRFAGVGPMAVGAAVSLYELGGWRLVLAVPTSVGVAVSASMLTEQKLEEQLKEELLQRLSESSAVPEKLLLEVRSAKLLNFETNRCKLDVQARTPDGISWHLEVRAERKSFPLQWQMTQLYVRSASAATGQTSLPPQTRHWDPQQEVLKWSTVLSEPAVE